MAKSLSKNKSSDFRGVRGTTRSKIAGTAGGLGMTERPISRGGARGPKAARPRCEGRRRGRRRRHRGDAQGACKKHSAKNKETFFCKERDLLFSLQGEVSASQVYTSIFLGLDAAVFSAKMKNKYNTAETLLLLNYQTLKKR